MLGSARLSRAFYRDGFFLDAPAAAVPGGPVLLALNTESELGVPQATSGVGLMDRQMRAILA